LWYNGPVKKKEGETMAIQAVLFDLDGTLLNTLEDIADSMNKALLENGLPQHPTYAYRYFVSDGVKTLARRATGFKEELAPIVQKAYQSYYAAGCRNKTLPYDGVTIMLNGLFQRGLKLCVFSNKPHQDTRNVMAYYFPDIRFDAILGQKENVPVKPDPTGALEIARELRIPTEDFLYVGDTGVDMACANAAGMIPVGALWGFRPREELIENHARHLIEKPEDLLALFN
jgi:phosphoglycolate phosphatase